MFSIQLLSVISIVTFGMMIFLVIKFLQAEKKSPDEISPGLSIEDIDYIKTALQGIMDKNVLIEEINKKVAEADEKNKFLTEKIKETRNAIDEFSKMQKLFVSSSQNTTSMVSQIEKVLVGYKPKDYAISQNIVQDALSIFPREAVEKDYPLAGAYVEFAIILPNRKIIPVESRFERGDILEKLSLAKDEPEKKKIINNLKEAVISKISESTRYTDNALTDGFCILALPDLIYQMSSEFLFDAFKKGVIVISYSNTIPYILTLLKMREKYAPVIDMQKLNTSIEYAINLMYDFGSMVETTMAEALTKMNNAHRESKRYVQELQVALGKVRTERLDTEIKSSISDFENSFKL